MRARHRKRRSADKTSAVMQEHGDMSVRVAADVAVRRVNRKLKKRMRELWRDSEFRKKLNEETKDLDKHNFDEYIKVVYKCAREEAMRKHELAG